MSIKHLCMNYYDSVIHNSLEVETTECASGVEWMNKCGVSTHAVNVIHP